MVYLCTLNSKPQLMVVTMWPYLPSYWIMDVLDDCLTFSFRAITVTTFQDILDFLNQEFGDTDRIRKLVNSVKELKLSVTPEEIAKLAEDTKKALASLTGIDEILQETEERLNTANNLKERAEQAR